MKNVISVSLGSEAGDFVREIEAGGFAVRLSREGTNGDFERAKRRIQELDGHVDAIGLGGHRRVSLSRRQALRHRRRTASGGSGDAHPHCGRQRALRTPWSAGWCVRWPQRGLVTPETKVLMVSALDRFGMAEAFVELGCPCVFGDLIFNIGLDFPLTRLAEIEDLAEKYRSRLLTVPFHMLYPTGAAQDQAQADPRYAKYYEAADIIAGDGHLILRHLPSAFRAKAS